MPSEDAEAAARVQCSAKDVICPLKAGKSILECETCLKVLPICLLKAHEQVDPVYLKALAEDIRSSGLLRKAILVDRESYVILDGHHRVKALELLGCKKVPCILVNYSEPNILVFSWRNDKPLPKSLILKAASTGRILPPKTSKHMVKLENCIVHVSTVEPEINIPLHKLK